VINQNVYLIIYSLMGDKYVYHGIQLVNVYHLLIIISEFYLSN